jgi:hypothetical protein
MLSTWINLKLVSRVKKVLEGRIKKHKYKYKERIRIIMKQKALFFSINSF